MDGIVIYTDTKWSGFPYYDAQVGTNGMCLIEVDPPDNFTEGQNVQFAVLAGWGTTPWQNGVVSSVTEGFVTVVGTA